MSRYIHNLLWLTAAMLPLCACSDTDILEPPADSDANQLTLTVRTPGVYGFGSTRSGEDHKLRLTARLYNTADTSSPIATLESLPNTEETTLSFTIDNEGEYIVTVFADYIDANATLSEGHYPDKYYSSTADGNVTAISDKGNDAPFFNNDMRDCFSGKLVFTKGLNAVTQSLTLRRPVSKILVAAPNDDVENLVSSLAITSCSHFPGYSFALDNGSSTGALTKSGDPSPALATISLANENATVVNPAKSLFFFYTFADEGDNRPALGEISFNLTARSGSLAADSRTVAANLIKPLPNYLIKVNGAKDWISAIPGGDDIIIEIQGLETWKEE